jgi:bacteriocin biosynthesis cyclodehydratase domain-containing protein
MQRALAAAHIAVIGVGGLGSWALCALACAGVGRLTLVDDDTVALSNLNRQLLYRRCDVGRPKVDAAAEALLAFNPALRIETVRRRVRSAADAAAAVAGADFVVETADWPVHEIGRWINDACVRAGVPHVGAGQFPPRVRIGPTYVPGRTGCLLCQEAAMRRDFPLFDELVASRLAHAAPAPTLGPASGLVGSIIAMDVVHAVTGIADPATLGRALVVDLRTLGVTAEPVPRDPACALCGEG